MIITREKPYFLRHSENLVYGLLIIATVAIYWQVITFEFVDFDDPKYITNNSMVLHGLTLDGLTWAFTTKHAANWHPLTWLSHMLDVDLFGVHAGAHHLINLFFHLANTLLLFSLLKKMTAKVWESGLVAALFALHPLHVESVAWISERKDLLCTFFWMLTIGSYIQYVEYRGKRWYIFSMIFYMLGLLAKPMIVTLPLVLLLLDYWPLNRFFQFAPGYKERGTEFTYLPDKSSVHRWSEGIWPRLVLEKVPFFLLACGSSIITFWVQQAGGAVSSISQISLGMRVANALVAYVGYIHNMFWPFHLAAFYPYLPDLPSWQVMLAAVFMAAAFFTSIRFRRHCPYFLVGWLWYVCTLLPVIGLVQVGFQAMADRYTYIPLIGLFIALSWGFSALFSKINYGKALVVVWSTTVLTTLAWVTYHQISCWSDSIALFERGLCIKVASGVLCKGEQHPLFVPASGKKTAQKDNSESENNLLRSLLRRNTIGLKIAAAKTMKEAYSKDHKRYQKLKKLYARKNLLDDDIRQYHSALYEAQGKKYKRLGQLEKAIFFINRRYRFSRNLSLPSTG
jgi:hypothetical protein